MRKTVNCCLFKMPNKLNSNNACKLNLCLILKANYKIYNNILVIK